MPVEFRKVSCPPLHSLDITAPDGAAIGIIGEDGAGKSTVLRLAAGLVPPHAGAVAVGTQRRFLGPADALNFAPVDTLLLDHALALHDGLVRARAILAIDRLRRAGATILFTSHDEGLLLELADEIWWLHGGKLIGRGDPAEALDAYRSHLAQRIRAWGQSIQAALSPRLRRGDGRAQIVAVETLGEDGKPTSFFRSGEQAAIRVAVKFQQSVADPVIGILIRTRVGLNVYGTNTELERLKFGPCASGDSLRLNFAFRCDLCPQEYTLTVASHDPNGVWHDWLEDAVAFSVVDNRHTAGVANLRAQVSIERI
ncbi:MAG TPA: Wzt carbohydrate-binding domain-containing protein [Bryobacteraceae bacterium]|nr:Wzt carbohydrate-binding domain-containing protein [Bryobacteraceae bacterium]